MRKHLLLFCFIVSFGFVSFLYSTNLRRNSVCANSISCVSNLTQDLEVTRQGTFLGKVVDVPESIEDKINSAQVLGATTTNELRHIYVDLDNQTLYAFEGNQLFLSTLVSTGRWGRTPTGEFSIWYKIKSTRMTGGSGSDYYDLPNVPFNMFFYNKEIPQSRGYALHGAYWHNNFGHEMSHGCVNLRAIDAEKLFYWTSPQTDQASSRATKENPGTAITICQSIQITPGNLPTCLE